MGKLLGNFLTMAVVEVFVLALFGLFYDVDLRPLLAPLSVVLLLGTVGLAAVGTLFAAMTAQVRARELLFPVLLLPAQVPLLLATVSATQSVLAGPAARRGGALAPATRRRGSRVRCRRASDVRVHTGRVTWGAACWAER